MSGNLLPPEELNSSISDPIHIHMRDLMPWLAEQFSLAGKRSRTTPQLEPFALGQDQIVWQLEKQIVPVLSKQFAETFYEPRSIYHKELLEDPLTSRIHIAVVLDLGLLALAFPPALETLYQLLDAEFISVRTFATLAIIYAEQTPPKLDTKGLQYAIETGNLFSIPLRMYAKILPHLKVYFQENQELLDSLVWRFTERRLMHWHTYNYAETAIFLAELDIPDSKVIDELLNWAEFFAGNDPLYMIYCRRCHEVAARLIEMNAVAMDNVTQKIAKECLTTPIAEVDAWFKVLLNINPQRAPEHTLEKLFEIADLVLEAPSFHVMTVQVVVNFANHGRNTQKETARNWLYSRLKSENSEIVYRTLKGIWRLENINEEIKEQVIQLTSEKPQRFSVRIPALETLVEWKLFD